MAPLDMPCPCPCPPWLPPTLRFKSASRLVTALHLLAATAATAVQQDDQQVSVGLFLLLYS